MMTCRQSRPLVVDLEIWMRHGIVKQCELRAFLNRLLCRWWFVGCCASSIAFGAALAFAAYAEWKNPRGPPVLQLPRRAAETKPCDRSAPPFASLAKTPDFNASNLAHLLLKPHPNMPSLSLSRTEVANLAEYIATLK
jgi:hypothetical protein